MARAYAQAGVDVDAGERAVEFMRDALGGLPGRALGAEFGALLEIPAGMRRPRIVVSTDGVGTKTDIARRLGRLDTIGQDLVAMCADDVVCHGARPVHFLDYIAVGRLDPECVAQIVAGIGAACAQIGCTLVGGETAEHPGLMEPDEFDLAGFCLGFVEADEVVDASMSRAGDVVIGMASSGLHSNGFALVRQLISDGQLTLTDELLTPTRLYATAVLLLLTTLRAAGLRHGGLAHITGGGLARNLPRAVGDDLGVLVQPDAWPVPPVIERVARAAELDGTELRATLNAGIGFAAVVAPEAEQAALASISAAGIGAWRIGTVRARHELGGNRYVEE